MWWCIEVCQQLYGAVKGLQRAFVKENLKSLNSPPSCCSHRLTDIPGDQSERALPPCGRGEAGRLEGTSCRVAVGRQAAAPGHSFCPFSFLFFKFLTRNWSYRCHGGLVGRLRIQFNRNSVAESFPGAASCKARAPRFEPR